ncbi:hypothetical protein MITSMUL_03635 [Mitsuokella multacida DSM 20544]|uniref:Uncharacterized protein n=1 Tax=Mitsuokella multacida DSM 20544 TaxID=500635 RepID=C9KKD6_9FIRM|nr:hypothetical protein MITSMUL_03635 [Mitsuokella multacida DSM 20544]
MTYNADYIFLPFRQNFIVDSYYSTNRSKRSAKVSWLRIVTRF